MLDLAVRFGVRLALFCSTLLAVLAPVRAVAQGVGQPLRVVTYNVAGLPDGVSRSRPVQNLPLIGERLNGYDLALVQEDFAYPELLRREIRLAHRSRPFERGGRYDFGDGLSLFSKFRFDQPARTAWTICHGVMGSGFDCLTPKGFSYARLELSSDASLDVYNVHLDAGRSQGDVLARAAQLAQLARALSERSEARAVIVAGDFNLSRSELAELRAFERATKTRDACRALACPEPGRVDRVLFRSSAALALAPARLRVERGFVDDQGRPLSDHHAVAVDFIVSPVQLNRDR